MAKYVQSLAKQELTQNSPKVRYSMYQVTSNQKEQLLNQIIEMYESLLDKGSNEDKKFIMNMYHKLQRLPQGKSIPSRDAFKLKNILKSSI